MNGGEVGSEGIYVKKFDRIKEGMGLVANSKFLKTLFFSHMKPRFDFIFCCLFVCFFQRGNANKVKGENQS